MNAKDARQKAQEVLAGGPRTEKLLAHVLKRIDEAANRGNFMICHPFYGIDHSIWPTKDEELAVFNRLREMGYEVKHHHAPTSVDPREHPYDEISWK